MTGRTKITVDLPDDLLAVIDRLAEREHRSRANMVRWLLLAALEEVRQS